MGQQRGHFSSIAFGIISLLFASSCVSVRIATTSPKKSASARYAPPPNDFVAFYPDHVDAAWKTVDGSSISYLSECDPDQNVSLANIQKGLLRSIESGRVQSEQKLKHQGFEALRTTIHGAVGGQTSIVDILVFNAKDCTYILTYVANEENFKKHQPAFNQFLQKFEVTP